MTFSCDFGWDIAFAVFWGIILLFSIFAVSSSAVRGSPGIGAAALIFSLVLVGLFTATATLCGKTKQAIRASTLPQTTSPRPMDAVHGHAIVSRVQPATGKPLPPLAVGMADAFAPVVKPEGPTPPIKA
jgi:hypothetical protein